MAHTFTGLKLQGAIGKFGQVELTDVYGYQELPNGNVVSGSDWGNMLVWEGNLIKCASHAAPAPHSLHPSFHMAMPPLATILKRASEPRALRNIPFFCLDARYGERAVATAMPAPLTS